jgi:mxaJ protein
MFSRFLKHPTLLLLAGVASCWASTAGRTFRVCADPNNLPFSNQAEEGFENRLARMIAADLNAHLEFVWWQERASFLRNSLSQGKCDAVMGVPSMMEEAATTAPYYRSTYVIVSRRDHGPSVESLLDPRLDSARIGVHVTGNDYAPPAQVLARRGLSANIVGFSLFGPAGEANPPSKVVDAVASGTVDFAIVWGPFGGYFAPREKAALDIRPVRPDSFFGVPFSYDIAIGVRKTDTALRDEINPVIQKRRDAIQSLLHEYGVPIVEGVR